ncbi:MAG: penicillin-binding transpeptidase domain-containing protein [Zetaproteobacteria bacterium]|nr:penicillin-binding transpeptidase domain-containing protein [Zetaproteobacteria bacterium]
MEWSCAAHVPLTGFMFMRKKIAFSLVVGCLAPFGEWGTALFAMPPSALVQPSVASLSLPVAFEKPNALGQIEVRSSSGKMHSTTLVHPLQQHLGRYLRERGNPIAAIVLADVKSGQILAMVQGKDPEKWGATTHSALYAGFPAASIFKVVSATAAVESSGFLANSTLKFAGGCGEVGPRGVWMRDVRQHSMSLSRAFARSCNNFFAKLSIQHIGAYQLSNYADKYGWGTLIPADFRIPKSPIHKPNRVRSSSHNVGQFAAGFGMVGMSTMHATWISLLLARDGVAPSLRAFSVRAPHGMVAGSHVGKQVISNAASFELRQMMQHTVRSGTASGVFRKKRYRHLRRIAGGKTGTLTSRVPDGLTTWFIGMMPVDNPQVVVSAVVVNSNRWVIKGTHLAAEGLRLWKKWKQEMQIVQRHSPHHTPVVSLPPQPS